MLAQRDALLLAVHLEGRLAAHAEALVVIPVFSLDGAGVHVRHPAYPVVAVVGHLLGQVFGRISLEDHVPGRVVLHGKARARLRCAYRGDGVVVVGVGPVVVHGAALRVVHGFPGQVAVRGVVVAEFKFLRRLPFLSAGYRIIRMD